MSSVDSLPKELHELLDKSNALESRDAITPALVI